MPDLTEFPIPTVTIDLNQLVTQAQLADIQTALDTKAPLESPVITGSPTVLTPAPGDDSKAIANTAFVAVAITQAIADLLAGAPEQLDTLNEIAAALADDQNFASTILAEIATKVSSDSPTITGTPTVPTATAGDNSTIIANTAFVGAAILNAVNILRGGVPVNMDTLAKIAMSINNDPDLWGTIQGLFSDVNTDLTIVKTKSDLITVTDATDLDVMRSRVNDLDAAVVLRGSWDASSGTFPGAGAAQAGSSWIVSAPGTVDGIAFNPNDRIISVTDNASETVFLDHWLKLDYTDQVLTVAGRSGAVVLTKNDVGLDQVANLAPEDLPLSDAAVSANAAIDQAITDEAAARADADMLAQSTRDKMGTLFSPSRDSFDGDLLLPIMDNNGRVVAGVLGSAWAAMTLMAILPGSARWGKDFLWAIGDTGGAVALGVDDDGAIHIHNAKVSVAEISKQVVDLETATSREGATNLVWSVHDVDGYTPIAVDENGNILITNLISGIAEYQPRAGMDWVWAMRDNGNQVSLGVRPDGTIFIAQKYPEPSEFSTVIPTSNVRDYGDFMVAGRIDTASYDVRRNTGGTEALIQHPDPMVFLLVMGQSNAGAQGPLSGEIWEGNMFPQITTSFAHAPYMHGATLALAADYDELAPITDEGYWNQYPANVTAQALEFVTRERAFTTTPGVFAVSVYEGGEPLTSFVDGADATGHYNWLNMVTATQQAKIVANDYGRTIECPAVIWIQGESGSGDATPYDDAVQALAADVTAQVQSDLGQATAPKFLIAQINSQDNANNNLDIAAWQIESHGVGNIRVAGPMYQYPLQDEIHINPLGKMMQGDMFADIMRVVRDTGEWTPLMMTGAVRTGAVIDVTFAVPGIGLAFDDDFVKAVTNHGFSYTDDSGSPPAISTVEIISDDTVRITLATTPTGGSQKMRYATWGYAMTDGWATGRGTLYSPTRTPSLYHKLGYNVPETARHYAVRQEIGVSS